MIDVTKFEGYTKVEFSVHGNIIRAQVGPMNSVIAVCYCDEPTKHLFASAPELLAEVLRLRERVKELEAVIRDATDYAGGRESEWGDRAEECFLMLYKAISGECENG